ncbi:MAG: BatA domain-containing protein, partial [Verrucomicrobiota bacterium]
MIGLIFSGVLAGLVGVGWPIYLHLRQKRKNRIQDVPSLRLFEIKPRKVKRFRLENILLLIARLLFIVFLCFLVSQPFYETENYLPLPMLDGGEETLTLGIVLDDSITSVHADETGTRLDKAKAWAIARIEALP